MHRVLPVFCFLLKILSAPFLFAEVAGYPKQVHKVDYLSSADQTKQPALFYTPKIENKPVPLLVALHTWSNGYNQAGGEVQYAKWCIEAGWCFIHPHFRGPNYAPEAMGSDLVVKDILSSIDYAKSQVEIDVTRIYCIGVSGGGHASLLIAGRAPEIWAGVSAWCGISDITKWHQECRGTKFKRYATHIEKALQGAPDSSPEHLAAARHRSPVNWLKNAREVPLDINHGVHDGRTGSVPFTHSFDAWNHIVPAAHEIPECKVREFYNSREFPGSNPTTDPLLGSQQPLFRETHHNTRLTIFEGGHEIIHHAALNWLSQQEKGKPVVWNVSKPANYLKQQSSTESGK